MTVKSRAILLVFLTAVLWSTGGFFIKYIDWTGISIAGGRSIIAAFFICLCLRRWPRLPKSRVFWLCAVFYSLLVIFFVTATKLTTAANAILLQYVSPIYVAILAPFILKEPTSRRDWLFIALALCGMCLFFVDSLSDKGLEGNILAIISGVFFASFCMCLRRIPEGYVADAVVWGNVLAFFLCLPFMDFAHPPSPQGWLALVTMGCVQLGLGYYLYSRAAPHLKALELIVIPIAEPILNPIIVAIFIREIPGFWSIIGGVVVLCSISVWSVVKARE